MGVVKGPAGKLQSVPMERLQQRLIRPEKVLEHNADVVLEFIKRHGPVSRAEIARALGFSKSAISNLTAFLLENKLLNVAGIGHPTTGRKSQLLAFNSNAFFYVSIDLRWHQVAVAIVNLDGQIITQVTTPLARSHDPADVIVRIGETVYPALTDFQNDKSEHDLKAVGVMVPGVVNAETGQVLYSSNLGWESPVDLGPALQALIGLPVYIENDANALALSELWVGQGKSYPSLVFLFLGNGVGGAFVSKSELLRGRNYAAVEVGKMIVCGPEGPESVETHPSFQDLRRLTAAHDEDMAGAESSTATSAVGVWHHRQESEQIVLENLVRMFGQVVTNVVSMFNPSAVFIDTPRMPTPSNFLSTLKTEVTKLLPERPQRAVELLPTSLGPEEEILGGAAIAIYGTRLRFIVTGGNVH